MKTIRAYFRNLITYFFVLLFTYASISKLLDFENFQVQIAQSPLLSAYAGFISYFTIVIELVCVVLLIIPKMRLLGLYMSLGLMAAFSIYIYLILNYSDFVPCSCGGILEKMGWKEHLVFNIVCVFLAVGAISILSYQKGTSTYRSIVQQFVSIVSSSCLVVYLFYSSEYIIKKENNFTRRYSHHPITEDKVLNLKVNSYYFAGYDDQNIYLGNYTAPTVLTKVDLELNSLTSSIIKLPVEKESFQRLKMQVVFPYAFLYDGSKPVIFRVKLPKNEAEVISNKDVYFNSLVAIDSSNFVFRAINADKQIQFFGKLRTGDDKTIELNYDIIKAQKNGLFDTDGRLIRGNNRLIYTYYYRNNFISFDFNLKNKTVYKTIDNIQVAQIKVDSLKNGRKKIGAPPLVVNEITSVYNTLYFNQSNIIGKHENKEMWKTHDIIDMYELSDGRYVGSFYLENRDKQKTLQILATSKYLFCIKGNQIIRYRYAQFILNHLNEGDAENPKSKQNF